MMLEVLNCRWVKLSGTDLLPGDIVSIGRSSGPNVEDKSVPADMLLLAGNAIVNEAILTGESTPQWKVAVSIFFLSFFSISGHMHFLLVISIDKVHSSKKEKKEKKESIDKVPRKCVCLIPTSCLLSLSSAFIIYDLFK